MAWSYGWQVGAGCWWEASITPHMALDMGLLECPHGMAANFPQNSNPTEQGIAPMAFMAYPHKLRIVVLTIGHTVQLMQWGGQCTVCE